VTDLAGQRILVTGADGFIGSHLTERLVHEGADVRALCLYNSHSDPGWLRDAPEDVHHDLDIVFGDIRDAEAMRRLVADRDLVLHLAALIAIPYSYEAPRSFVDTNIVGTQNLLEAVREAGCRMVNTSTSEVYGTPDEVPITESHPLKGQSPYAATKIAADKLCEAYARSFEVQVTTLRPFNTFGPRQSLRAVIPTVLAQLLAGVESLHVGSLSPRRDFTFVGDTVEGFVRMATADLEPAEVIQLGTGVSVSIGDLVELCMKVTDHHVEVVTDPERVRPEASEVQVLLSDPGHAKERIGWTPQTSLEDGLARTAVWVAEAGPMADPTRYHR
jgi:NAD dependent epimerase/dehydratase